MVLINKLKPKQASHTAKVNTVKKATLGKKRISLVVHIRRIVVKVKNSKVKRKIKILEGVVINFKKISLKNKKVKRNRGLFSLIQIIIIKLKYKYKRIEMGVSCEKLKALVHF